MTVACSGTSVKKKILPFWVIWNTRVDFHRVKWKWWLCQKHHSDNICTCKIDWIALVYQLGVPSPPVWNFYHHCTRRCLTHWGRETLICVSNLTIIGSDNGLSPGRAQAIIWTNAGILFIGIIGSNFSEILSDIYTFSFKKMHLIVSPAKWRQFCLGLNVLTM